MFDSLLSAFVFSVLNHYKLVESYCLVGIVSLFGLGLLWINSLGHDEFLSDVDFWTMGNIPAQSDLFWYHLFVAYFITFIAFYLLRKEYQAYQV